jgi:ATP-dependent helicase YprA (DUF1998 family)
MTTSERYNAAVLRVFPTSSTHSVRAFQEDGLKSFIDKKHTLVIAQAGSGKSKIPALILAWALLRDPLAMLLYVGPTIALEQEQAQAFRTSARWVSAVPMGFLTRP